MLAYKSQVAWAIAVALVTIATVWYVHSTQVTQPLAPIDMDGKYTLDGPGVRGGVLDTSRVRRSSRLRRQPLGIARARLKRLIRRGEGMDVLRDQAATVQREEQGVGRYRTEEDIVQQALQENIQSGKSLVSSSDLRRHPRRLYFDVFPTLVSEMSPRDRRFMQTQSMEVCDNQFAFILGSNVIQDDYHVWFIRQGKTIKGFAYVDPDYEESPRVAYIDLACAQVGGMRQLMKNIARHYRRVGYDALFLKSVRTAVERYLSFGFGLVEESPSEDGLTHMYYPLSDHEWTRASVLETFG